MSKQSRSSICLERLRGPEAEAGMPDAMGSRSCHPRGPGAESAGDCERRHRKWEGDDEARLSESAC